jgi:hypothetical protein
VRKAKRVILHVTLLGLGLAIGRATGGHWKQAALFAMASAALSSGLVTWEFIKEGDCVS